MYYLLLLLTLLFAGCANPTGVYVSDTDATTDPDGGGVGLIGSHRRDSATADEDAGTDTEPDAMTAPADMDAAVAMGMDAATTDATTPNADAATPPVQGTTCDSCADDSGCETGYVCAYRSLDMAKHCFAVYIAPQDCPDVDTTPVFRNSAGDTCCGPNSNHTCVAYRAEWK